VVEGERMLVYQRCKVVTALLAWKKVNEVHHSRHQLQRFGAAM